MDKEKIERICIDDFALKKRHRYGTIIIDIDTKRIVDVFESREKEDVAMQLSAYPNVQVVSRDGSAQYAMAIRQAHPNAIQVSDRFHIIKNLTDYAKQHITKTVSTSFRIPAKEGEKPLLDGYWKKIRSSKADLPAREHEATTEKKHKEVEKVRLLTEQGYSITETAKEVGLCYTTTKKYLNEEFSPENNGFGRTEPSKLKPYTKKIDQMLTERCKFKEIEAAIREDGYNGASSTIRMYATRKRNIAKSRYRRRTFTYGIN